MIDPIYKIKTTCMDHRSGFADHITSGGAGDFSAYCKAVGAIQALDLVLTEIAELERRMREE